MIEATSDRSIHADHGADQHSERGRSGGPTHQPAFVADGSAQALTDPVCGMTVTVDSPDVLQHEGKPLYFCSSGCKAKFVADPAKYPVFHPESNAPTPPDAERTADGAIYTCPMHPQIRQEGPGNCPICGMALEPVAATAVVGPNHELVDMTRRFWIGLVLTLPVFVLEMGGHIPGLGLHDLVPPRISTWIQFALSTPVVLWAGWPFFERAWASVVHRSLNMFTLIALGTGAAYLYSLVATLAPEMFPAGFRGMGGTVAVYFEAAAVITVLVLLGQVLELRAREQTGGAIRALLKLAPKTARRRSSAEHYQEQCMNKNQVDGRVKEAQGKMKEVTGNLLGDKTMEAKGKLQKLTGETQAKFGDIKRDLKRAKKDA